MEINSKRFKPQKYQKAFFYETLPFACRVGPWADGKTLNMIMKSVYLSMLYPGNEGLIIRKQFNALSRSTIRDFTTWTGIKVSEQSKKAVIDCGNGIESTIHFAHCENMNEFRDGIQGMNLGFAGIEQGDEMESADIFEMLMGRLRRIVTPNRSVQDALIKAGLLKDYVDDFNTLKMKKRRRIERYIIDKLNLPVRQIMVIANACGHNWIYKRWIDPKHRLGRDDGYAYSEGKPFENTEFVPETTIRNWNTLKKTSIKKYNRYVLNSHEDYDIEGSYYASLMSDALKEGRCEIQNLYDPTEVVYTFWDLGVSDDTTIWFAQFIRDRINLIDYYSNTGEGITHYSKVMNEKGYEYMAHYLPHDVKQRMQGGEVTTRLDILKRLRQKKHEDVFVVERHAVQERIQAVRDVLRKCYFDEKCSEGVESLNRYHREKNKAKSTEETTVFIDKPAHDQYSHGADSFGGMAIVHQLFTIDGVCLGATGPRPDRFDDEAGSPQIGTTDLLEVA